MSYILDALKKNQAEQAGEGMSVNMSSQRKAKTPVWVYILVAALLLNGALLAYFILEPSPAEKVQNQTASEPQPVAKPERPDPQPQPQPQPELVEETIDEPVATTRPPPSPVQPTPRPQITEVTYDALTPAEQVAYDSFSYTSHIFTDAKDLRAIVIDGQRVQIGDSFKGLKIYDITETGVIFEENRRGTIRRVQVSPFE